MYFSSRNTADKTNKIHKIMQKFPGLKMEGLKQKVQKCKQSIVCDLWPAICRKDKNKLLSIDFGQGFVKIAHLEEQGACFRLLNYDIQKISSNQENKEEAVSFIKNFLQVNSITTKEVCLTIYDPDCVIIKHLTLPAVPKDEIAGALKWQLKEEVAFDLKDTLLDWQVVKEYIDEGGVKQNEIIFILAKTSIIDRSVSIVFNCGLRPIRISSSPFNYENIIRDIADASHSQAILDLGYKNTTFCIYKNKKLNFIRALPFSSDRLTKVLTGGFVSNEAKKTEIPYTKAERIKQSFDILQENNSVIEDNILAVQVMSLMRPLLEELVKELRRSFDYFTSNFKQDAPTALYLTGGGSNLKNLSGYLSKELDLDVSELPLSSRITIEGFDKERLHQNQNQIISALGAVLAGHKAINLLPYEIRTKKVEFIQKVSLRLVAIVVGAVFLFSLFVIKLQMRDYENRLKNAKVHLDAIRGIEALKQRVDARENLIDKLLTGRVPVDGVLRLLAAVTPNNIILSELSFDHGRHSLVLIGVASGKEDIAESAITNFMEALEASSFYSEATLVSLNKLEGAQRFEIKCDIIH